MDNSEDICPACGRVAIEVSRYTGEYEGQVSYKHEIDRSGGFPLVTDSCLVEVSDE